MDHRFSQFPRMDQARVVVLTNYLRRHHALVYQEVAKSVGELIILLSTEMEPDRNWTADWGDLDVRVQSNWMYTARWRHSNGFDEQNFIHIPIDTFKQLRQLNPDIVFSYEMGMRTAFSSVFRMFRRKIPLVMVGNMADHIEIERGMARRAIRNFIRKRVDFATYNGPSCKRYLLQIGYDEEQLFHFPYCIDFDKTYAGPKSFSEDGHRHLIYSGALSDRKGILPFSKALRDYLINNDAPQVTLSIAGGGELAAEISALANDHLTINMLGNCDPTQLSDAYQAADICVFPTLGDEWGLVPVEAMASSVPVLGSTLAQSVEATVVDGVNGWSFHPLQSESMTQAIGRSLQTLSKDLDWMGQSARQVASEYTPENSANKFCDILRHLNGEERPQDGPTSDPAAKHENVAL